MSRGGPPLCLFARFSGHIEIGVSVPAAPCVIFNRVRIERACGDRIALRKRIPPRQESVCDSLRRAIIIPVCQLPLRIGCPPVSTINPISYAKILVMRRARLSVSCSRSKPYRLGAARFRPGAALAHRGEKRMHLLIVQDQVTLVDSHVIVPPLTMALRKNG